VIPLSFRRIYSLLKKTKISIIAYKLAFVIPAVSLKPPIDVLRFRASKMRTSRPPERSPGGIVDRVSSCSSGEEGESAECGRASTGCGRASAECSRASVECGRAFARCGRVSLGCSSMMFSSCRRVSDCEEPESDELE
jgi:hypothetical protein